MTTARLLPSGPEPISACRRFHVWSRVFKFEITGNSFLSIIPSFENWESLPRTNQDPFVPNLNRHQSHHYLASRLAYNYANNDGSSHFSLKATALQQTYPFRYPCMNGKREKGKLFREKNDTFWLVKVILSRKVEVTDIMSDISVPRRLIPPQDEIIVARTKRESVLRCTFELVQGPY